MSRENVDAVRQSWEAWKRRDIPKLFAFYDEAVEWDMSASAVPDMGIYRGHQGVRDFFRDWVEDFENWQATPIAFIDADDSVVVTVRQTARGKGSGAGVDMLYWQVYRLRGGKAVRVEIYRNESEALEAVGLRE
jgi:ketosteroid isomerase-like protein